MGFSCYKVNADEVAIKTKHNNVFLHHITEAFGIPDDSDTPAKPQRVLVVGHAVDNKGEAFVVEVDGSVQRPSGGTYHITASCADGVAPVYSNELIKKGWNKILPFEINVEPHIVRFKS